MFHFDRNLFRKLRSTKIVDNLSAMLGKGGISVGHADAFAGNAKKGDCHFSLSSSSSSFPITILNCPKSLKFFVQFYRLFGYSFTGVTFEDGNESDQKLETTGSKRGPLLFSIVMMGISASATIFDLFLLLFAGYYMTNTTIETNPAAKVGHDHDHHFNESSSVFLTEVSLGIDQYMSIFAHMKPILRSILQALIYIYLLDNLLMYPLNLVYGGRLVQLIATIPNIRVIDRSRGFALRLLGGMSLLNLSFSLIAFALLNRKFFLYYAGEVLGLHSSMSAAEVFNVKHSTLALALYPIYFLVESMATFLFIYVMHAFKRNVELLREQMEEGKGEHLGETELLHLKVRLLELSKLFRRLLAYFSLPLTVSSVGNVYLLITSACFLMVPSEKTRFYTAIILNFGSFGVIRLFSLCLNSTLVTREYAALKAAIAERKVVSGGRWSTEEWIAYTEIRRLKKKFKVNIWQMYSLNHSAILTLLGFALNQIVVLLQTENFADTVVQRQNNREALAAMAASSRNDSST